MKNFSKFTLISVSFIFLYSAQIFSQEVEEVVVTATKKSDSNCRISITQTNKKPTTTSAC